MSAMALRSALPHESGASESELTPLTRSNEADCENDAAPTSVCSLASTTGAIGLTGSVRTVFETLPWQATSEHTIPGSGRDTPGSGRDIPGSGRDTPGSGRDIPGSGRDTPGSGRDIPGSGRDTPGSGRDIPGSGRDIPGSGRDIPGSGRDTPGSGRDIPGSSRDIPGTSGDHARPACPAAAAGGGSFRPISGDDGGGRAAAASSHDHLTPTGAAAPAAKSAKSALSSLPVPKYSWLVCAACFLIYCVAHGTRFASGLVYTELLKPPCTGNETTTTAACGGFGSSASTTAWIFSLYSGMLQGLAPLSSRLIKSYGCQFVALVGAVALGVAYISSSFVPALYGLFITYGIIGGAGACLLYNASIIMIGSYFRKKRATANGIALSGAGFGGILVTFVAQTVLPASGWRHFLRYMTMSAVPLILATLLLTPQSARRGRLSVRRHSTVRVRTLQSIRFGGGGREAAAMKRSGRLSQDMALRGLRSSVETKIQAMRSRLRPRLFALMVLAFLFYDAVSFIPFFLMPDIKGLNPIVVTYCACAGLGVGSIIMGFLSSQRALNPCVLQATCFGAMGLACIIPVVAHEKEHYLMFVSLYGLFNGGAWSLFVPTMVVIVGAAHIRRYIGVVFFIGMLGTVTGPPAAGAILDLTQSYRNVFLFTLTFLLAAAALLAIDYLCLHWQEQHEHSLIHKSELASMMRGLAKETSLRAAVPQPLMSQPRATRPPLLHRQSTVTRLFTVTSDDAMHLLDMPYIDDLYDDSLRHGPMDEFSIDEFRAKAERKSVGSLLGTGRVHAGTWNGAPADDADDLSTFADTRSA